MQTSPSERSSLIFAAQSGDPVAIERVLAVCQADSHRYSRRYRQSSIADQAVQDALLVVARRIGALKARGAFLSWLFTVIRRERRRIDRTASGASWTQVAKQEADRILSQTPNELLRVDLAYALESLPARFLKVILLRDFDELTIREIAGRLGEPGGAIEIRLHRARKLVREYLLGTPD
jgi:RNA polymerase sigma factor (sigma-70 family)